MLPQLKKALKWTGKAALALVGFIIVYALAAVAISRITIEKEPTAASDVAIYIKTNGVHTDIVLPVRTPTIDWSQEIKYTHTQHADSTYPYLALGWGDKGFYLQTPQWSDLKFSVAFNAAFGLSTSAIHATFYSRLAENESCRKIYISSSQYARLAGFILSTFTKGEGGHLQPINAHYGAADAFYEAEGHYNLFYTCNTWANSALKHCGQRCCLWTVLDKSIFAKYNQ
jgi:uncharacterized protein (TIGR02117 family)